jgi:hypothetical protein
MTLRTLTPAQLRDEREHLEMQLSELLFSIHTRKDRDNISEMHDEWTRKRYADQIESIDSELETRNV